MINIIIDCLIDGSIFLLGAGFGYCIGWFSRLNTASHADDLLNYLVRRNRR